MWKQWKQCQTWFWGAKITADGDCSHEIKRRLLLGRKVMSNLDSILKSRDIPWLTKVHLVKVMVFPVIIYGCESWTIKKAVDVQSLSRVRLFATPWTVACQVSLPLMVSQSLLKFMSVESVMPSKHLILCHPLLLLPSIVQHQGLFQWVSSSHQVAKVLDFHLQHQSFQQLFRVDFL